MAGPTKTVKSLGHILVSGGNGFLGGHIVDLLLVRNACSKITILDLKPPTKEKAGVSYQFGDITDYDALLSLFQKIKPTIVIHTASPDPLLAPNEIMYKVNVDGTKNMVKVSQETGVKALVYTSSASVISDNRSDLINADEEYPVLTGDKQPMYYTNTKALAESHILSSNRSSAYPHFLTAAIRPSAMFGEGDNVLIPQGAAAYYRGQTKFQVGTNENLFDFTDIRNVAHAHHLCAAALLATVEREEGVDGEAFFITNDSPTYFFDFARMVWRAAGDQTDISQIWVIPKDLALFIATILGWVYWAFRLGTPKLSRDHVQFSCMTRYFNIDKAKRRLGYRPVVGLVEGVRTGVRDAILRV
ncbi:erg26, C-3 sterol dehydrogenase [Taxawa tesnikishii (nom. ined.)]|nr:erg26, C-3 sterol dehydrogenase [Dothideales sp. JES 119]